MDDVRTLLVEQVRGETPASTISVSQAVGDGRRVLHVRRVTFSVSAVLVVGLVAAGGAWFDRPGGGKAVVSPTQPASRSVRPSVVGLNSGAPPSGEVLPPGEGPGPANVPVMSGVGISGGPLRVRMPDGTTVTLPTPPGSDIDDVVRVPGGWVYERTDGDRTPSPRAAVWYLPDGGTARKVTDEQGGFAVSDDGTTLVVAGVVAGLTGQGVTAYRLPSLSVVRHTTFSLTDMAPVVHSYHGDWVLLAAVNGEPGPSPAELWSVATGAVVPFASEDDVWGIGVSADGRVLREVFVTTSSAPGTPTSCMDYVTPAVTVPTGYTGFCAAGTNVADEAWLSPTGEWAVLHDPDGTAYVVATGQLGAGGDLRVGYIPADAEVLFWDTASTFVARPVPGEGGSYYHCDQVGACSTVHVAPGGVPVPVAGG